MLLSSSAASLVAQERPADVTRDTAAPAVAGDSIPDAARDSIPDAARDSVPGIEGVPESAVVTRSANLATPTGASQDSMQPPVTPMGAFVRSLVIPGWGQAAVDQPGRGAFYFAASSFTIFMVAKSQSELDAARLAVPTDQELVDSKKGKRETWIVLAIFVSLFSAVDAWVSAHLWDFEGEITPPDDGSAGVQFQYNVPLEGP